MSDLTKELRDKTRLRKTHGLSGWVLHEEALTDEAADEIDRLTAALAAANAEYCSTQKSLISMHERAEKAEADLAALKIKLDADAKLGHAAEDEITALRAEVAEARAEVVRINQAAANGAFCRRSHIDPAELYEIRADAERYRWLRDNKLVYRTHPIADGWTMDEVIYDTAEQGPDAAIDAARKP